MSGWRLWLAVIGVGLISAWAGYQFNLNRSADPTSASTGGDPSPLLATPLADLEGHSQTLSAWPGKTLVVNFWATWCPPCREELPTLSAMQNELGNAQVQFIGIAIDEPDKVREFLKTTPVSYPTLIAPASALGLTAALGNASQGLPFTLIIDAKGRILSRKLGLVDTEFLRTGLAAHSGTKH